MLYTCDCGYPIQNVEDEQDHLKTIHPPINGQNWTPKNKPKVGASAKSEVVTKEPETKKNLIEENRSKARK